MPWNLWNVKNKYFGVDFVDNSQIYNLKKIRRDVTLKPKLRRFTPEINFNAH